MSAQTGFTLPALGGAKPVHADTRTSPYNVTYKAQLQHESGTSW